MNEFAFVILILLCFGYGCLAAYGLGRKQREWELWKAIYRFCDEALTECSNRSPEFHRGVSYAFEKFLEFTRGPHWEE